MAATAQARVLSILSFSSSFRLFLRSNAIWSVNAVLPPFFIKEKSTKASDDEQPQTLVLETYHSRTVHVGNLRQSSRSDLVSYFSKYGKIEKVDLVYAKFSRLPRGFAFVTFCEGESAKKVLDSTHSDVGGDKITVNPRRTERLPPAPSKEKLVVLVTNILKTTTFEAIERHFSQFGKVQKVILAQKGKSDDDFDKHYVTFSSVDEAKRAVKEPTQRIAEQDIDSQVLEFSEAKNILNGTTNLCVRSLGDNISVDNLKEYFQKFGDVEFVEGFLAESSVMLCCSVAYVHFSEESTLDKFQEKEDHIVNGVQCEVLKQRRVLPLARIIRQRISVEGLPLSITSRAVKRFFENEIGIIVKILFFRKDSLNGKVHCVIGCLNEMDRENVLAIKYAMFQDKKVHFNPLLWSKRRHRGELK